MIASGYIDGLPVVFTDVITKKVRSRTHRKKRIDKKWLKRYGYKEVTDHEKLFYSMVDLTSILLCRRSAMKD